MHSAIEFKCCGPVKWFDDFGPLAIMREDRVLGLKAMEDLGVLTIDPDGSPFMNANRGVHLAWSLAWQNRVRMNGHYEELDRRLSAIGA